MGNGSVLSLYSKERRAAALKGRRKLDKWKAARNIEDKEPSSGKKKKSKGKARAKQQRMIKWKHGRKVFMSDII